MTAPWIAVAMLVSLAPLASQVPAKAQAVEPDFAKLEAELNREAIQRLIGFAHVAEGNKVLSRAKESYQRIIDDYDDDNAVARVALGFHKEKGVWVLLPVGKLPNWSDTGDLARRQSTTESWARVSKRLADLHRVLGLQMLARDKAERGRLMLERAILYDPADAEAHKALGHGEFKGFYGTPDQVAFLERMAAIEAKAKELAAKKYEVEVLAPTSMPDELHRTGLEFTGARSRGFTIWARAGQEQTNNIAAWAERTIDFMTFLLSGHASYVSDGLAIVKQCHWLGILHSDEERDLFFDKNPKALGKESLFSMRQNGSWSFNSASGFAEVHWVPPENELDCIVAQTAEAFFARDSNHGLGYGLVHAITWLLVGTTETWYGAAPSFEQANTKANSRDAKVWLAALREEIKKGRDFPLQDVPREHWIEFRLRTKSWYFVTWLLARYPDRWAALLRAFPDKGSQTPEDCAAVYERVLGGRLGDIEAEWREWAGGESRIAKASGHGLGK